MKLHIALAIVGALLTAPALASSPQERGVQDKTSGKENPRERDGKRPEPTPEQQEKRAIARQLASYPLTTCPTSGEALGADAVDVMHEGRLVRFCCTRCAGAFKKDPAATLKKVDDAVIAAQKAAYPMERCPVEGAQLGESAVNHVHGTRLMRFCSDACVATFKKDPEEGVRKLETAYIASQRAKYPLATCLVMEDEKIDAEGDPIDHLYGTRLVRFCCKKCVREFEKEPTKYLAKLDDAAKAKRESEAKK